MKYVISDIHGCFDEFTLMLKKINFSNCDDLYIIGDTLDRGDKSLEVLDFVMDNKNIHLIKGNHELFYQDHYETLSTRSWERNGGDKTLFQLSEKSNDYKRSIYEYIVSLPYIMVVDKFILVHACVSFPENYNNCSIEEFIEFQEEDICLWSRDLLNNSCKFKDYTIICGHTPVQSITNSYENPKIIHRNDVIFIDCGCVFEHANGKLACLRLDDMAEFYI